jgi:hypothetical protein
MRRAERRGGTVKFEGKETADRADLRGSGRRKFLVRGREVAAKDAENAEDTEKK